MHHKQKAIHTNPCEVKLAHTGHICTNAGLHDYHAILLLTFDNSSVCVGSDTWPSIMFDTSDPKVMMLALTVPFTCEVWTSISTPHGEEYLGPFGPCWGLYGNIRMNIHAFWKHKEESSTMSLFTADFVQTVLCKLLMLTYFSHFLIKNEFQFSKT